MSYHNIEIKNIMNFGLHKSSKNECRNNHNQYEEETCFNSRYRSRKILLFIFGNHEIKTKYLWILWVPINILLLALQIVRLMHKIRSRGFYNIKFNITFRGMTIICARE